LALIASFRQPINDPATMNKKVTSFLLCMLVAMGAAHGADWDRLPAYQPGQPVNGELRIWASPADGPLLNRLAGGFGRFQPQVRITLTLHGPDSTLGGVTSGVADLALMARELRQPVERMAFEWVYHHPAFSVEIANAGLAADRPSGNLAVMVHRDNPLAQLTLTQLDAILGAEHRRGSRNLRTWGELGLDGPWKDRPIHVYGPEVDSIDAMLIRARVLKGSYKWNPDYAERSDGRQIAAALAADPAGIGYLPVRDRDPHLKALALGGADGAPFVALTEQSAVARSYPLARVMTIILNREPGQAVEPRAREFLRYVLSREGQQQIARDGAYLPLDAAQAAAQLDRLR
jgi:phosphate transport system substrate-binding protein